MRKKEEKRTLAGRRERGGDSHLDQSIHKYASSRIWARKSIDAVPGVDFNRLEVGGFKCLGMDHGMFELVST